jgi:hypothetical protein
MASVLEDVDVEGCVARLTPQLVWPPPRRPPGRRAHTPRATPPCPTPLRSLATRLVDATELDPAVAATMSSTSAASPPTGGESGAGAGAARPAPLAQGPRDFLRALYVQAAKYCFGHSMDRSQIEAFCGIVQGVVAADVRAWQRGAEESFASFQAAMLTVAVDRPPRGIPVFTPLQATLCADFMLKTYYAQFRLYKYCLSAVPEPVLEQHGSAFVAPPPHPPPLAGAVLIEARE